MGLLYLYLLLLGDGEEGEGKGEEYNGALKEEIKSCLLLNLSTISRNIFF